jgi:uncharacterized protein (TIGR03083 family)
MNKDAMFDAITSHRMRLIDRLETLTPQQWDSPSLCEGWRVREVVGHLVSIIDVPMPKFIGRAILSANFDKAADMFAKEYGARDRNDLIALYRSLATKRFAPPVIGPIAPLTDLYIHTLDIARPLGLPSHFDDDASRTVLSFLCGGKGRGFVSSKRTSGLRFVVGDLDWSTGSGPLVAGSADAMMLAVTARRDALGDLSGDGLATLRTRLSPV